MKISQALALAATVTAAAGFFSGCSHAKPVTDNGDAAAAIDSGLGSSDDGKAMGLQTVHFAYDSNHLDAEAKSLLKANAAILSEKTAIKLQIEGHCDARGGIQFNIALGERRAKVVRDFLVAGGVAADRLETISYGKERPLDSGTSDEAYAKNRRAAFVITSAR